MTEKHILLAAISRKGTRHRGNLRLQWRTFAAEQVGVPTKTVIDATMCAIIA